jgi:hypothetical protein
MTQHNITTQSGAQRHLGTNGCQKGRQKCDEKTFEKSAQKYIKDVS